MIFVLFQGHMDLGLVHSEHVLYPLSHIPAYTFLTRKVVHIHTYCIICQSFLFDRATFDYVAKIFIWFVHLSALSHTFKCCVVKTRRPDTTV